MKLARPQIVGCLILLLLIVLYAVLRAYLN